MLDYQWVNYKFIHFKLDKRFCKDHVWKENMLQFVESPRFSYLLVFSKNMFRWPVSMLLLSTCFCSSRILFVGQHMCSWRKHHLGSWGNKCWEKTGMGESRAGDGPKALKNQITNSWRKTPPDSTLANLPFCSFLCFVSAKIAFLRCCS